MQVKTIFLAAALSAAPGLLHAQLDFKLAGRDVQVHSFVQQGFAYSNENNFLTMNTSQGSFAMTDGGVNIGMSVTDKFHVGAQVYLRNIGELGKWRPELDWAFGDYKFKDWFGVRAGKVKTALGLYNDTQDAEFLHTWAILPQSVYPLDLRSNSIAHVGADVYGDISLRRLGKLSYTGYVGARTFDPRGGYYYFSQDQGIPITSVSGRAEGGDIRWHTPLEGLQFGASFMDQTQDRKGIYTGIPGLNGLSYDFVSDPQHTIATYFDFTRGGWHFNGELRKSNYLADIATQGLPGGFVWDGSEKGWFLSVAYRVAKRLELGTYHSRYYMGHPWNTNDPNNNHIYDQAVTARFDITRFWNCKVEAHFMDGYGDIYSAHGFYGRSNPNGLKPTTNMLVLRTGFTF
jgi:hypothetical protein